MIPTTDGLSLLIALPLSSYIRSPGLVSKPNDACNATPTEVLGWHSATDHPIGCPSVLSRLVVDAVLRLLLVTKSTGPKNAMTTRARRDEKEQD